MYKSCYEVDIKLPDDYVDKAMKAFDERLPKAYKDRAPDAHIDEYPELFEIFGDMKGWFAPKVRLLNHTPNELGTTAPHFDVNEHWQYEDMDRFIKIEASLNVPLFAPEGVRTFWYQQKNPDVIHPYDFWEGKEYEMRVVDEFEITNKPVLFRTGIWHAVQKSDSKRTMLSFSARYGIDWDTFVNCWKDSGLLIER